MLNYIIWNVKPQIIDLGSFELRYYSLLFAVGFIISYVIIQNMLKRENIDVEILDKLTVYVVLSTIIGARLGHTLFYEFDYYIRHPLEIFLPWRGTIGEDFRFTGYQGLASHGGVIGIIIGIYLFKRKTKVSYFWTLDRLAILAALVSCLIRTGNLMNSEIYGKPTQSESGFVFSYDFTRLLERNHEEKIEKIRYQKTFDDSLQIHEAVPVKLLVTFSHKIKDEKIVRLFAETSLKSAVGDNAYQDNIFHPSPQELKYSVGKEGRNFVIEALVYGVPRHPTQIYEALSYLAIFIFLMLIYYKRGAKVKNGFYVGVLLTLVFSSRFIIEFVKENQEEFENTMALNMGQILSIPFVIAGIALIFISIRKEEIKF
jgi:phosphatidylglycerol---prolipoprotein diacylglyceryl transferase